MKPQLNLTTAAWAAGIYEGEGTCDRNKCVVRITQKDSWVLKQIAHLFGGRVAPHGGRYWRWTATGLRARFFIVTVWPWLSQGRRDQAGFIFKRGAMEKALWQTTVEAFDRRGSAFRSASVRKHPRSNDRPPPLVIRTRSRVERKPEYPRLPRFAVVPARAVMPWDLGRRTTVVEVAINGAPAGQRAIQYLDEERWFLQLPEPLCRRLGIEVGDSIELEFRRAATDLPAELARVIRKSPAAKEAWERLTTSQKRMLSENVAAAKRAETRERRAARELLSAPRKEPSLVGSEFLRSDLIPNLSRPISARASRRLLPSEVRR